ncbi:hypothetical protein ACFL6S_20840 [Candidatus Poribacteria bacterium]
MFVLISLSLCIDFIPACWGKLSDAECELVRERHEAFAGKLCEQTLQADRAGELQFALSALWLNHRVDEGNEQLRKAYREILDGTWLGADDLKALGPGQMTPERAGCETVKWKMRMWLRVYYLFHEKSEFFPGRLVPDVQSDIRELLWNYGAAKSTVERSNLEHIWWIQGSENHDMMDLSNAFLALQAIKDVPEYQNRKLPDGHTPAEHVAAWNMYYKLYCDERAKHGLFAEVASPTYGKWFLPEIANMYDFAEDAKLQKKMEMLLHLTWADWSIDQLRGMRGGGRTRVYQGNYSRLGAQDSWRNMGLILLGRDDWLDAVHGQANYVLATTKYRLPDVIVDLALSEAERGEYIYISLRPAKLESVKDADITYPMDGNDPYMLRYSYCTPDYVTGSLWLDPAARYAAISTQNRWQGIIFPTHVNARVFPQCVGLRNGKTYAQHLAVQHQNVMLVQKNRKARQSGDMRVFFYTGMKSRVLERDGWILAEEGEAYIAVRVLPRFNDPERQGYIWDDENWLRCKDDFAPIVFVAGRKAGFTTTDDFLIYLKSHQFALVDESLTYSFQDIDGKVAALTMDIDDQKNLPIVNGQIIDLKPDRVFDSPYLHSENGSGLVTIEFNDRRLLLDFGQTHITSE